MTVLSVAGGKGRGPIEGEEPDQPARIANIGALTTEEAQFLNNAKEWLGNEFNERILIQIIKSQQNLRGPNVMNDVISTYFDRIQSESEKTSKQVRFNERLDVPSPAPSMNRPSSFSTRGTSPEKPADVVDLTSDDDKGSSKWGDNVLGNREEQDMIKAIAESLKDNQNIPGFSPFAQKDPENPHERTRIGLTPVGLKNTGNSCWFNVIVQTLVHIPQFRQLLLDFNASQSPPLPASEPWSNEPSSSTQNATPISFVLALRRLTGFLVGSKRSYVDPYDVLSIISDLNTSLNKAVPCMGIQQDAMEMLLRLTEWIEQAFKSHPTSDVDGFIPNSGDVPMDTVMTTSTGHCTPDLLNNSEERIADADCQMGDDADVSSVAASPSQPVSNPFSALFHGSHIEIRQAPDGTVTSSKLNNALQMVNLDVSYDNLHDSLEAYHFSDSPEKELWFDSLPPVIVFSLVRFSYKNGQTEKVHSKFHFPGDFYMDRYMHSNREFVTAKRMERAVLKEKLSCVKAQLKGLEKFPVGSTYETLPNIINAVRRFTSPAVDSALSGTTPKKSKTSIHEPMELCDGASSSSPSVISSATEKGDNISAVYPSLNDSSLMEHLDIGALDSLLKRLADDAQSKINDLQMEANLLQEAIDKCLTVDNMMQEGYRLHSVLIHEGEANVGHYWAYVADHPTLNESGSPVSWCKFNDKSVEPATWQQIEEDSFGSRRTCSAYCLVYTRKGSEHELFGKDLCLTASSIAELVATLPADLMAEVSEDNAALNQEIAKWDKAHVAIPLGPVNRPHPKPHQDQDFMGIVSHKEPLNVGAVSQRHYEQAFTYFGAGIVNKIVDKIREGNSEDVFWEDEKCVTVLFSEVLENFSQLVSETVTADSSPDSPDSRLVLTEWARISGIAVSSSAQQLFIIKMLMHTKKPRLVNLCISKAEEITGMVSADISELQNDDLQDAHLLFEMFCQTVAVVNEIMKKYESYRKSGTRSLRIDVNQVKLLCAAVRMADKIRTFSDDRFVLDDSSPLDTLIHALLMLYAIRISQELVEEIDASGSDDVLLENTSFLQREYKAILVRVHNLHNAAAEKTVEYISNIWNQVLSNSNGLHKIGNFYQVIVEASEQKTISDMPPISVNVKVLDSAKDFCALKNYVNNLGLRNTDSFVGFVRDTVLLTTNSKLKAVSVV